MVNASLARRAAVLLLAAVLLAAAAWQRSAEYDEQYTLFLTAGVARPAWPDTPFRAGAAQALQAGHASLSGIAADLRATDVHPPLYFWAAALWRRLVGPSLFAARLLSVLCGLGALAAIGAVAVQSRLPPALSMLLTLGCYGFAYTAAIARGFALAQLLTLAGVAVLLQAARRNRAAAVCRGLCAGLLLGAASAANYLAVFAGAAAIGMALADPPAAAGEWGSDPLPRKPMPGPCAGHPFHRLRAARTIGCPRHDTAGHDQALPAATSRVAARQRLHPAAVAAALGLLAWMPLDLWCFLAQRASRSGQFPPFHLASALSRLAACAAGNLLGGLPLYAPPYLRWPLGCGLAAACAALVLLAAIRWRQLGQPHPRRILAAAALAPPCGLLLLGLLFDTTPIELRYLALGVPFAALLLAGAVASLPRRIARGVLALLLVVQAAALAGLLARPETMQPARAAASAAASLADGGLVLLPRGNDGVGIAGAFAIESPPRLRLLLIGAEEPPAAIRRRIASARRVVLAFVTQDAASRAAIANMRAAVLPPCWRRVAERSNVAAYERLCQGE